ncbi:alanine racemase [Plasticicumulans lactativorans]|uniref:Alanine racemase n=1 Tax=Plasticicumulans lactativorans TaxID=1133106 RepID=A0A4R2L308_9GAMM|nr:alanine racemase [Plasticicumulans lactativorans]TCO80874.1 alanine racemase [Plasticicumulans lactativorans]
MRPATAVIDLAALRHNLGRVRALAPHARVFAVVKADGYGHGAARLLPALGDADALAVACIEEALALRAAGATQPVLLLEGVFEADELALCAEHGFEIAVRDEAGLRLLEAARLPRPLKTWLKLDTGMHRLGIDPRHTRAFVERLRACPAVADELGVMSHLASADDPAHAQTAQQLASFEAATTGLPVRRALSNSAGVLAWPAAHHDWVRPGIMLYGCSPMLGQTGPDAGLKPVMTFSTGLIQVKTVARGETIGYSGTFTCPADMRVGIAAVGYADGYPRHAPTGTPVLVNGRPSRTLGRVSMDMLCVDLTDHPEAQLGDRVTLWGEGLPAERIAEAAGTIAYEILCNLAGRVHKRVIGG